MQQPDTETDPVADIRANYQASALKYWHRVAGTDQLLAEIDRLNARVRELQTTCAVCDGPVGYIDCPTGGWWAHAEHPDDHHDADPVQRGSKEA